MAEVKVRAEGLRDTLRALEAVGAEVQDLKDVLGYAAEPVVDQAKRDAPVRTGATRKSIRLVGGKTRATVRAGSARLYYVPMVHYGTKHIRANPWLDDAADAKASEVPPRVDDALNRLIERVM